MKSKPIFTVLVLSWDFELDNIYIGKFFFHYYYSEPVSNVITVEYCGFLKRDLVYESLVDRSNEDSRF